MKGQNEESIYIKERLFFGFDPHICHFFPKKLGKTVDLQSYQANFNIYHIEMGFT